MSSLQEIAVPDIGDFKDIPVIEINVRPGDTVAVEQTLIVLESDKATLDVPSSHAGIVREVKVVLGDRVSQGSLVVTLETVAEPTTPTKPAPTPTPTPASAPPSAPAGAPAAAVAPLAAPLAASPAPAPPAMDSIAYASPSLRQFARELGVDLSLVGGTGRKQRITREDVQAFVKTRLGKPPNAAIADAAPAGAGLGLIPWPQVDFSKFGETERAPLSKIKKISGANLSRNAIIIPHVTNFDEADVTDLEAFRIQLNKEQPQAAPKITMLAFTIKAMVSALKKYPTFNASLDGDELILKHYYNIGFAADTPNGLVVPVIKMADRKGIAEIAAETSALAGLAREGKLKPGDMQGAGITISSLGGIGGTGFTPIINAPEVAIMGAARAQMKPVWDGKQFQPRLIMPVSLSWDHRVIDGAFAARFLVFLTGLLADFRRVAI